MKIGGCFIVYIDDRKSQGSSVGQRPPQLCDLVTGGEGGVEVVFSIERRGEVKGGPEGERCPDPRLHACPVEHRESARDGRIQQGHVTVGRTPRVVGSTRKQFGPTGDLNTYEKIGPQSVELFQTDSTKN